MSNGWDALAESTNESLEGKSRREWACTAKDPAKEIAREVANAMARETHLGAIVSAGILLGTGLGGFVDGILLHQILQWHNMLSSVRPPVDLVNMKYNMVWDGIFHAFTWSMVVLGV